MPFRRLLVALTLAAGALVACQPTTAPPATPTCSLSSLVLSGPATVVVGESIVLNYTPTQSAGSTCTSGQLVGVWSSDAPGTASVVAGAFGFAAQVNGVAAGPAVISVNLLSRTATRAVTVTPAPVASILVTPANPTLLAGQTQQMAAACLDSRGQPTTPCAPVWSMPANAAATITPGGLVTAVAAGTATAVATSGSVNGQTSVTVTAAPAQARLAYGLVAGSGTPDAAYGFNSLGGALTAVRQAVGRYQVTIPGFGGAAGESRLPFVNAISGAQTVCVAVDWTMIGVTDATVNVECTEPAGIFVDSDFVVMAIGQGGLPGDLAFGYSGPVAGMPPVGTTATLPAATAWSTAGSVQFRRDDVTPNGRYQMLLGLPVAPPVAFAVVQAPAGQANSRCTIASYSGSLDVVCYPPGSATFGNAPFVGMLLEQGRPGQRIASAWANAPSTASYQAPVFARRNSAGGSITIQRTAVGTYQVQFQGMGRPAAARREVVMVTTQALFSPGTCRLSAPWSPSVAVDLTVHVRCIDGSGVASDQAFFILVIE